MKRRVGSATDLVDRARLAPAGRASAASALCLRKGNELPSAFLLDLDTRISRNSYQARVEEGVVLRVTSCFKPFPSNTGRDRQLGEKVLA
jgi:hypothetical protein